MHGGCRRGYLTHTQSLPTRLARRSPDRISHTHTIPANKTCTEVTVPSNKTCKEVAEQGITHTHIPLQDLQGDRQIGDLHRGRRTGYHTHAQNPFLQDLQGGRRTGYHRVPSYQTCKEVAGQGITQSLPTRPARRSPDRVSHSPFLPDLQGGRRTGYHTHTHSPLQDLQGGRQTGDLHIGRRTGYHTHAQNPFLQDLQGGRRTGYHTVPSYQTCKEVAGQGITQSLPTRPARRSPDRVSHSPFLPDLQGGRRTQYHTLTHTPFLQDLHAEGGHRGYHTHSPFLHTVPSYKTCKEVAGQGITHTHSPWPAARSMWAQ